MNPVIFVAIGIGVVLVAYAIGYAVVKRYRRFSGPMAVECPETRVNVGVKLDVPKAMIGGVTALSLAECSRWPERAGCDQACIQEIAIDPERALVLTRLREWYAQRTCVQCSRTINVFLPPDRLPSLIAPDGALVALNDLRGDCLDETLATHLPICWDCALAESFRRRFPERVVDNPWGRRARVN